MTSFKVMVTRCGGCNFWYRVSIGETFMVHDKGGNCVRVVQSKIERDQGTTRLIEKFDCEPTGKDFV